MNDSQRMLHTILRDEVIDRCLEAASFCLEFGNDRRANALMKAEFREIAREVARMELSGEVKAGLFLLPMQTELFSRHGHQIGQMLYNDFVDAFWIQTWTDIPLDAVRLERAHAPFLDWHIRAQSDQGLRQRIADLHFSNLINLN